jgi:hypothetical protein
MLWRAGYENLKEITVGVGLPDVDDLCQVVHEVPERHERGDLSSPQGQGEAVSVLKATAFGALPALDTRRLDACVFPVRPETHETGQAFFGAHIKLERFKSPAPRLHFYDDTTGLIYIGYYGPHLPTSRTN